MGKASKTYMATPKGMSSSQFQINATDSIHIYSNDHHIWIQLRRAVPTEVDLGKPSFKTALCLTPGTAQKLGQQLLHIGITNEERCRAKAALNGEKPKKSIEPQKRA